MTTPLSLDIEDRRLKRRFPNIQKIALRLRNESKFAWRDTVGSTRRILVIALGVVAAIAVAFGVVYFAVQRQLSSPNEVSAQYIPADALFYTTINIRPGVGQLNDARKIIGRLQTRDFTDMQDDAFDALEDESGIHLMDDLFPALGSYVSLAALDDNLSQPEWVALIEVSDRNAAEDVLEDLVSYLEDEGWDEFDADSGAGLDLWTADEESLAFGLSDTHIFIADSEDTIEDMRDNIESPPSNSLANDQTFIEARDALPSGRFMFTYLRTDDLLDAIEDEAAPLSDAITDNAPDYIAASASFFSEGIRFDTVSDTPRDLALDAETVVRAPSALPEDTLAMLAIAGMDRVWEEATHPIYDLLDRDGRREFGYLFDSDVVEASGGEFSIAALPSDLILNPADMLYFGRFERFGFLEVLLLVSIGPIGDQDDITDILEDVTRNLDGWGFDIDDDRIGEYKMATARYRNHWLFEDYEGGYIITDEWAAVGTNINGLEEFYDVYSSDADSLSSNPEFGKLIGLAPEPVHMLLFANMPPIIEIVEDSLDGDMEDDYERNFKPYLTKIGGVMAAASTTKEMTRFTIAVSVLE